MVSPWRAEALSLTETLAGENLALQTGPGKGRASGEWRCGRGPEGVAGGCVPGVAQRAWPNPAAGRTSPLGALSPEEELARWASQVPRSGWESSLAQQAQGHERRGDRGRQRQPGPSGLRHGELSPQERFPGTCLSRARSFP